MRRPRTSLRAERFCVDRRASSHASLAMLRGMHRERRPPFRARRAHERRSRGALVVSAAAGVAYLTLRRRQLGRARTRRSHESTARATTRLRVLQPIRSGDPTLEATLRSTIRLASETRHDVEIDWLVDTDDPVALDVCTRVRDEADEVVTPRIRRLEAAPEGVNPKTWKLAAATADAHAEPPILVVLDDDTRLTTAGLDALVAGLERGVCLATGLPAYRRAGTRWSRLTADWVNTSSVPTYLGLPGAPLSVNGMCYAVRSSTLHERGGFASIAHDLTDDFAIAGLLGDGGASIVQTSRPQLISTHVPDLRSYLRLLHRWMTFALVLLRRVDPVARRVVAVQLGLPPLLLAVTLLAGTAAGPVGVALAFGVLVGRAGVVRSARAVAGHHGVTAGESWGGLVTELVQPFHVLHAALVPVVTWRGRRFRVSGDGTFRDASTRTGGPA